MLPAYSPQARGRGERSFGTWHSRLPQELRLAGITTLDGANRFLREHYLAAVSRTRSAVVDAAIWIGCSGSRPNV
jgi:hypothetical protein